MLFLRFSPPILQCYHCRLCLGGCWGDQTVTHLSTPVVFPIYYDSLLLRISGAEIEGCTRISNRLKSKERLKKLFPVQIVERRARAGGGRRRWADRRRKGGLSWGVTGQRREVSEEVTQPNTLNEKNKCQNTNANANTNANTNTNTNYKHPYRRNICSYLLLSLEDIPFQLKIFQELWCWCSQPVIVCGVRSNLKSFKVKWLDL